MAIGFEVMFCKAKMDALSIEIEDLYENVFSHTYANM